MEKDKIFFGENGLTSTSANFISNLAKESYRAIEQELDNLCFFTTEVSLIGSSDKNILREGRKGISDIPSKLEEISKLKSLIAWLREAIKAKESLIKEASALTYGDFGIEEPEYPERGNYISLDDVLAEKNIKQRNRYYYLETCCAQIGKVIHPDGSFAKGREQLQKILLEPHTVNGTGRDTLLYTREPSIDPEEVDDMFMMLQQKHREYQAELNSIKHDMELEVQNHNVSVDLKYQEAMNTYYNAQKVADAALKVKIEEAVKAAADLKIIIPDSLKPIYDKVQAIGKK